jgi:hypothetical protein
VSFPVLEEAARGKKEGNHWYCLSLNIEAGRFEALDSMKFSSSMQVFLSTQLRIYGRYTTVLPRYKYKTGNSK